MEPRISNPAVQPEVFKAMQSLAEAAGLIGAAPDGDLSTAFLQLLQLRASQINGCSVCVDGHWKIARKGGEKDDRLFAVAAWRDTPYFTEAERAALELTEAITRLADRDDPVPDDLWAAAAKHYDEKALSTLVLNAAIINVWNRVNVATKQQAGVWSP